MPSMHHASGETAPSYEYFGLYSSWIRSACRYSSYSYLNCSTITLDCRCCNYFQLLYNYFDSRYNYFVDAPKFL